VTQPPYPTGGKGTDCGAVALPRVVLTRSGDAAMVPCDRIVLKHLPAGHRAMPETWFLERNPATGAAVIGHTYWRVEEGGQYEGADTERWPLAESEPRVPADVWQRATEVASQHTGHA
jgi:hypothetical protein